MNKTINSYNQSAEKYEQRWASYLDHTHRRFLSELKTDSEDILLDVSCGTGLLAMHLIENGFSFKKLILNDISAKMQQKAKQRLGNHPDVIFTQQNAGELNLDNHKINKIFCLNALHNYKEQQKVLQRFYNVLQSGGQLYLLDWNNSGWFQPINWMIKKWVPETINTISLQKSEVLLQQAGFKIFHKSKWRFRYWKLFFISAEKF